MKISKTLLPVVAVAALFSGCQDEDFGYEAQDIKYQKEFKAAFGDIDPNQDFNLATRASVTVSTTSPSRIKIYAKHGDRFKLVGDYAEVSGTQTLGIDVVEGTTELRVSNGSFAQETTVGGNVTFMGSNITRGITETSISRKTIDMLEMSHDLATAWVQVIPERGTRREANALGTNLGKVIQDFTYVSNGEFTMYPMYSCTNSGDVIGIYYTDAEGVYHEVDIMDNTFSGDDLQYKRTNVNNTGVDDTEWQNVIGHYATYGLNSVYEPNTNIMTDGTHILDNIAAVRGHGVTINLPKGTVFGMYLRQGTFKFYSESALNDDVAVKDEENADGTHTIKVDPTKRGCHAASFYCTVEGKEYQFLGFEDWHNGTFPNQSDNPSDFDLNDFMVLFDGVLPHVNDEETPGWILAYEDLGNDFDWDYNDIVAKVQHVSGQDYATFTALAAVGTLDSYVKYKGEYITGNKATSEVHAMFGAEDEAPHAIINGTSKGASGTPINFTVPTDFSMTVLGSTDDMGGISLVVENKNKEIIANVEYAEEGNTPKVLCLPEFWYDNDNKPTYKYEWAWPTEHSSIKCVYPEFAAWVSNKNSNTEWYKHPAECEPGVEGKPGDDTKGSYVSGVFQTKMASGSISERADQPITILQKPLYMAYHATVNFTDIFSSQSNGTITVTPASDVVTSNGSSLWAQKIGTTTVNIHQLAGADKNDATKMWPTCDETVEVIVLNANNISLGTIDQNRFYDKSEITITAGESVNVYFKSDAKTTAVTKYTASEEGIVTIGEVTGAAVQFADGYATVTGVKAGETVITVSQLRTADYVPASKTITIKVNKGTPDLTVSTNSVAVGRGNTAEVEVTTNNKLSDPTVEITSGSGLFTAEYQNGKIIITGQTKGSGSITVSQAGNDSFEAATPQTISVEVTDPQHDLKLTSATSVTLDAADATSQITASSSTGGTVQYEVSEGANLIEVSSTGLISVKNGPGRAKVRVYVEGSDDILGAEAFVDVNVTYENIGQEVAFEWDGSSYFYKVSLSDIKNVASTGNVTITINYNGGTTYQLCGDSNAFGDFHGSFGYNTEKAQITVAVSDLTTWYSSGYVKLSGGRDEWSTGLTKVYVKAE